jgi:hypothetical protein
MRDCAHLSNEQCQRSKGCDAKFLAMGPIEQGQPFGLSPQDASTVRAICKLCCIPGTQQTPNAAPF